jgi:S-adenosyl-L-methionine hydrolase (adenosine-forming)
MITLTTDFGISDHFVGTMKGVIAGIAPRVPVVDVTHHIERFNILDGAFTIAEAYRYFPPKTVHVVVVDPGVGTSRRPLLVEAAGQYFIGPDNGVFSMILDETCKVRAITNEKMFLGPPVSRTFHGRDIFAPCAAHLARGAKPAQFGKLVKDAVRLTSIAPERTGKRVWTGTVLKVDHFGNLITNFQAREFESLKTHPFEMLVGIQTVRRLALTYQECNIGELFVIEGSSGYWEVSTSQGSAAKLLGCGAQAPVELTLW